LEVIADASVAVVAVDEEQVDGPAFEERSNVLDGRRVVGVRAEELDALPFARERFQDVRLRVVIAAAEPSLGKVDRDQEGVRRRESGEAEEGATAPRSDLEYGVGRSGGEHLEQRLELRPNLEWRDPDPPKPEAVRELGDLPRRANAMA